MVSRLFKILSFLFFLAYSSDAISQSLAFSQVLTFDGTINAESSTPTLYLGGRYSEGPAYIVPSGKVWKIESFSFHQPSPSFPIYVTLKFNSTILKCTKITGGSSFVPAVNLPFWLKAGDVVRAVYMADDMNSGFGGNHPFAISILEFTAP